VIIRRKKGGEILRCQLASGKRKEKEKADELGGREERRRRSQLKSGSCDGGKEGRRERKGDGAATSWVACDKKRRREDGM